MMLEEAFQFLDLVNLLGPVQIQYHIKALPVSKASHPQIEQDRADEQTANHGGHELESAARHSYDNHSKHIGGIQCVTKDIAESDDRKHRHQSECIDDVVG